MTTVESTYAVGDDVADHFNGYRLRSAYQPIFSLSHRRAVGFEALVRAVTRTDRPVPPIELFESAAMTRGVLELDAICQRLHIGNFAGNAPANRWMFLNLDPATITERRYRNGLLADVLAASALSPHLLAVEILEGAIEDEALLIEAVEYFRAMGALVALDDFGAGHSNFDRIWRLAPDIVKLDRSLIVEAEQHGAASLRRILPNLVSLMHEAGSLVIAEGIETDNQALIAMDADVDFVQGFYFAQPQIGIADQPHAENRLEWLTGRFTETTYLKDQQDRRQLAPYTDVFRAVVAAIEAGAAVGETCQSLLDLPRTARCYLLNEWGEEIAHYPGKPSPQHRTRQWAPITNTTGGSWFRRRYFRNAISSPRRLHVSRPYLSCVGADMCITLSTAYGDKSRRVLCCDVYC